MYGRITFTAIADGAYPFIHAQEAEAQPRLGTIQNNTPLVTLALALTVPTHTPSCFITLVEYTCLSLENFSTRMDE